ncbi:HSP20-like chaperone, partial [Tothia fuscella]
EFSPLFTLADELDRATRGQSLGLSRNLRSFNPRFDVKETKESYELHGELPGIAQKDINIEWSDDNTLTISGQSESRSEYNDGQVVDVTHESNDKNDKHYQKPTAEDEGKEGEKNTAVTKTNGNKEVAKADDNTPRYWVTERSFGSFHRTFQFPARVDHENVSASLKDGILSMVVPKAKAKEPRKVTI